MRRLTLVRHAKSDWGDFSQADFDRPLNARGQRDAPAMGRRLHERGDLPERMVASPAVRAATTARCLAEAMGYDEDKIIFERSIYEAPVSALLHVVQSLPDEVEHAMMVGHNPGSEGFVHFLTGSPGVQMVTCSVVDLELKVGAWTEVGPNSARLRSHWFPKMFQE